MSDARPILHATSGTRSLHLRPLVACLTVALTAGAVPLAGGVSARHALIGNHSEQPGRAAAHSAGLAPAALGPATAQGVTRLVTTCDDQIVPFVCDGVDDGTLRKAYSCAHNGDTVDLTQLKCSVISLSGALTDDPAAPYVTLQGPGKDLLTIDAGGKGRALVHNGRGALSVIGLTIKNGVLNNPYGYAGGGCIYSYGNVTLQYTTVSSCAASAQGYYVARGGAVFANHNVALFSSTVSGNSVYSPLGNSAGAGIYANTVTLDTSTVSGNTAAAGQLYGFGAGIYATGNASVAYSTISGNAASGAGGGLFADKVSMFQSTVSGNDAVALGGLYARTSAHVYSSTIARNTSGRNAAGLLVSAPDLRLESTIVALNKSAGAEYDVGAPVAVTVAGTSNLIMASAGRVTIPQDTISADPKLGTLADNGGPTQTHALLPGSPAIDHGNNITGSGADQRLFKRVVGPSIDIGSVEFVDEIFAQGFDPGPIAL
jgi:hypothetical protein